MHWEPLGWTFVSMGRAWAVGVGIAGWLAWGSPALGQRAVLETGRGLVLERSVLPVEVPVNVPSAALRFEVAFGTDELLLPGEFVDSLTVTLRTTNRSHSVTLMTVDRFGVVWAPGALPGGLLEPATALTYGPMVAVPVGMTPFDFVVTHAVLLQLPEPFLGRSCQLIVSLFDNGDGEASRGELGGVSVRSGNPATITVESSAAVAGPYAPEDEVRVDPLLQTITLSRAGARRFYRLAGETSSRVLRLQRASTGLVFDYDKEIGTPVLAVVGANAPDGPFLPVPGATIDLAARQAVVPLLNAPGFLRVSGSHPILVTRDVVSGEQRLLGFQVFPISPGLESSADVEGPYAPETGVVADPFLRRLRLPGGGVARFYRVKADVPVRLRETVIQGDDVRMTYELP